MELVSTWKQLAHIDPPEGDRVFYLGPNHYPGGIYVPKGYDLEYREAESGWMLLQARDPDSKQILTMWVVPAQAEE